MDRMRVTERMTPPMTTTTEQEHTKTIGEVTGVAMTPRDRAALITRLRRFEGQVRGIQRMVNEDAYCLDILTQVTAARHALQAVAVVLTQDHLRHCVADAAEAGADDATVDDMVKEASGAIAGLVFS